MSGLVYTASFKDVAVSAAQDLFEILFPSDVVGELLEMMIGQTSDFGDTEEEIVVTSLRMVSGAPTSGSGGSTATPRPHHLGGPASGATVEINNTTQLSGGTNVVLEPIPWNVRMREPLIYIPESRFYFSPSTRLLWELENAPADAITCHGKVTWKELGG